MLSCFRLKNFALIAFLSLNTCAVIAAQPSGSINASRDLSLATGSVVVGTVSVFASAAALTVVALEKTGESAGQSIVVVLKGTSDAAGVSVKIAASAVGTASLAVGSTIRVVAEASGYALYSAGKLIAFIPNEIGKTLVHHSKFGQGGAAQ